MLSVRLLFLVAACFAAASCISDTSIELLDEFDAIGAILGLLMKISWEDNKQDSLEGFVSLFRDIETNITVVGTQNVYDQQGNLDYVHRIDFNIPALLITQKDADSASDESEEVNISDGGEETLRHMSQVIYNTSGVRFAMYNLEFDIDGEISKELYMDKDFTFLKDNSLLGFYNFTKVTDQGSMEAVLSQFKENLVKPTIVHETMGRKFIAAGSVFPPFNAFVKLTAVSEIVPPTNVLEAAIHGLSEIAYQYPDDVPKQLTLYLNKLIPAYKFLIFDSDTTFSVDYDFSFSLQYYSLDLSDIKVLVVKK